MTATLLLAAATGHLGAARASEPRGEVRLDGGVDLPSGPLASSLSPLGGDVTFSFGLGTGALPGMIGIAMGDMVLGGSTQSGPTVASFGPDGLTFSGSSRSNSIQFAHLEAFLRVSPPWTTLRPFAEASIGGGALWLTASDNVGDSAVNYRDETRAFTFVYGFSAGFDVFPWGCRNYGDLPWKARGDGIACFGVTFGVRSFHTGPLDTGPPILDAAGTHVLLASARGSLHEWEPFVSLTLTFDPGRL